MQGGSWISTGEVASPFARWWFRRHFFQHAGFRLARSIYSEARGRVLHLPINLITTQVFVVGSEVQGMYDVLEILSVLLFK